LEVFVSRFPFSLYHIVPFSIYCPNIVASCELVSKKRGLSYEEKRVKLREIFLESKSVHTLKELEKMGQKQKGIISQSVKEVLQSICDDAMCKSDKIGTSNYFWCFPSDELNQRNVKFAKLEGDIEIAKKRKEQLESERSQSLAARKDTPDRVARLTKLAQLQQQNAKLKEELQQLADNNPLLVQAMRDDAEIAKQAANRWTDAVFSLRSLCTNTFGMEESAFNTNFQVPETFDYIQ